MKKISKLLFLVVTTSTILFSCTPEEIAEKTTDPVAASITIDAANAFDLQTGIQINSTENTSSQKRADAPTTCAVISVFNSNSYPKVVTVDYGSGCKIGLITRKGKLKITFSAPITETGSIMTIKRINYSINGMKLEGEIDYENSTTDPTVPKWTRTVTDGKFTNTNGKVFTNSGSCTIEQSGGVSTPFLLSDNVYEMTAGEHVVTNEAGSTLTLTVIETLVKKYSCDFISKGKLQIVGGILNGVINYGTDADACDNDYTYTHQDGVVYELKMY
ncbi:MAG: hypothetical protein V4572_06990 [Bacteroidota bacterium]